LPDRAAAAAADDHIGFKSIRSFNPGRVFAAIKCLTQANAPLIVRSAI
jgi:hypothetical protein